MSAREPHYSAEWLAVIGRIETWKQDASALDLHRCAEIQDRMGDEGYLPSKEELRKLRLRTFDELVKTTSNYPKNRGDAVKVRRLLEVALLHM